MRILALVLLVGCSPELTLGDAVDHFAEATCARQVRCGWTSDQASCEAAVQGYICSTWDCQGTFTEAKWDALDACTSVYEQAACSEPLHVCTFTPY